MTGPFTDDERVVGEMIENAGFKKDDSGKPKLSLLPAVGLEEIAIVMQFGAEKYGRDNWKDGAQWTRYLDASLRHLHAFSSGDDVDHESGQTHLAHAGCCILFLLWYYHNGVGEDDRSS